MHFLGGFHALFHIMDTNQGGHGFSEDGLMWEWGGLAYVLFCSVLIIPFFVYSMSANISTYGS